ncbi:MAG: hypothetical protein LIO93_07465 [Bacteroidales bacterium]|nr:hypothetical protein [Bacteroidales bacterium]MCC8152757.1 hypothetical protein [Tannerellaceae bacterium]
MRILFTAPRYHTNQVPIVKGLLGKGHEVRYFVVFKGASEEYTFCEPTVLKPSKGMLRQTGKQKKERMKKSPFMEAILFRKCLS